MPDGSFQYKSWISKEDPGAVDGPLRYQEQTFLRTLKAISDVFPDDALPFDSLVQYRQFQHLIEDLDSRLRSRSAHVNGEQNGAERDRLSNDAMAAFHLEFRLSRKHKLAKMALSQDWSGLPSYAREGAAMWNFRFVQRLRAILRRSGLNHHRGHRKRQNSIEGSGTSVLNSPTGSDKHSDLKSNLARLGFNTVKFGPTAVIRSGSLALDEALGVGGLPRGRIVEIFGKAGTGKTTLALKAAGNAQLSGEAVAYIDVEHKLDLSWAQANGLRIDQALILQETRAKAIMDAVLELTRSERFALIVVDSLSALVPEGEVEGNDRDWSGELDRLFARALPKIAAAAVKSGTCVLFLNQIRKNEELFGREKVSTGSDAIVHFSSIRLELARTVAQKEGDKVVGYGVKATVLKSCVASPFRVAEWIINFERGVDPSSELIELATKYGIVSTSQSTLAFRGEHLGNSKSDARAFLLEHTGLAATLEANVREHMRTSA